ncbi:protein-glutamate O-methyltransferase CheR [Sanguibacter sp. HDW7]|uniref:CheR family methyltransferase n=1 Tax=Sanguibacter sp. HDW7 TaxID=2714931 RepID=UPI00140D65A3|nr:protein-glutamate O-methyltransferase CheR [Sanguibacter sp. HDW7]QIK84284.1 protein-glutamate O-methyltransferase CheR [Sanguibacter sp. HDW7]
MTLTLDSFEFVADLVRRRSAISLGPGKEYLVESRLAPLARERGDDVEGFVRRLRQGSDLGLQEAVVEAMTTNETSWFRDHQPFDALRSMIVPMLLEGRVVPRLDVWSAACSTGQEPYSIVMMLDELLPEHALVNVTATDLSNEVLDKARSGSYTQLEVNRGLPAPYLVKHFRREGAAWTIDARMRQRVRFLRHNLLDAPPAGGPFDVVFLRNVLIYFDLPVKQQILRRMAQVMRPGGFLVLGAAETTVGVDDAWERVPVGRTSVYRLGPGRTS